MTLLIALDAETFIIYLIANAILFIIFYYVVKAGVTAANKETNQEILRQLKMINQFKVEEMMASGVDKVKIQQAIDRVFAAKRPSSKN